MDLAIQSLTVCATEMMLAMEMLGTHQICKLTCVRLTDLLTA